MSLAHATAQHKRVTAIAAQEGLEYRFDQAQPGNTFDSHRMIHFAKARYQQEAMQERLMKAYFTEGLPISDIDTLIRLAVDIGLNGEEARAALKSDAHAAEVRADEEMAAAFGIHGVPFFVLNRKYGISGAQPSDVFLEALERAYRDPVG